MTATNVQAEYKMITYTSYWLFQVPENYWWGLIPLFGNKLATDLSCDTHQPSDLAIPLHPSPNTSIQSWYPYSYSGSQIESFYDQEAPYQPMEPILGSQSIYPSSPSKITALVGVEERTRQIGVGLLSRAIGPVSNAGWTAVNFYTLIKILVESIKGVNTSRRVDFAPSVYTLDVQVASGVIQNNKRGVICKRINKMLSREESMTTGFFLLRMKTVAPF
ncbi:hypothetical protein TWF106_006315 [Orbilia oligospora]|uniref:Uncharacterized protein n=1 Tax=Orbilia oligospora TaxID=2813651 RepID=A0A7C8R060_ORBOL|nr:hypothetical protein TWF106_006315 [Orbilia oligospora]